MILGIALTFFVYLAWQDFRTLSVPVWTLVGFWLSAAIATLIPPMPNLPLLWLSTSLITAAVGFLMYRMRADGLNWADLILLHGTLLLTPLDNAPWVLMTTGLAILLYYKLFGLTRGDRIPLAPCLLLGWILTLASVSSLASSHRSLPRGFPYRCVSSPECR